MGTSRVGRPAPYRSHSKSPAEVYADATVTQRVVRSAGKPELQRGSTSTSVIDVLDHILDKGIVIDAWVRVSVIGIDLITVEARVVVASIETYLNRADAVAQMGPASAAVRHPTVW
jgi:Gas vesicle protein